MSEPQNTAPIDTDSWMAPGLKNAQLVYILYFVSFLTGLTAIIGIVIAYINRGKAGGFVETHYTWQIRTFWIGILGMVVSLVLFIVGIGMLLSIAVAVWAVVRLVIGLQALGRSEPIPNPQSWWIK